MDTDDEEERTHEGVERVWGPLPFALTSAMGAHAPVCSCVLRPVLDTSCLAGVEEEVLHDALPAPDETREALLYRLARSTAFDNPRIVSTRRTRHGHFKLPCGVCVSMAE